MKTCTKCLIAKPTNQFHKSRAKADGLHSWCKTCEATHKASNRETLRAADARWRAKNRERVRASARDYYRRNTAVACAWFTAWKARNPEKRAAHIAVSNALQSGRLLRPLHCERCPSTGPLEAHHEDYSRPLDVNWLCSECHTRADAERRARAS